MTDDQIWRALADPTRREILDLLRKRPHTTGELAERFDMSRYGVMKHLGVLVEAHLVIVRRQGRMRWNHLNAAPLVGAIERWAGPYQRAWANSLLRIRDISEKGPGENAMEHTNATTVGSQARASRLIQIEQEIPIAAAPDRVYHALTSEIDEWWTHPYRIFDESDSLIQLDSQLGGFLVERAGNRQALWGMVTGIAPGVWVEITGRIGMSGAVHAVVSFEIEPRATGSLLKLSHRATGEVDEETQASYDAGWRELLSDRLVNHLRSHPAVPVAVGGAGSPASDGKVISKLDVVIVYVEDQDRIVDFFVERLGFEKRTDAEMTPGRRWIEIAPPVAETGLAVLKAADFDSQPDDAYPATFTCADLDESAARLELAGVQHTKPIREPWGTYLMVTDPDGRTFLMNDRPGQQ